jgi:hypothetical protein
MSKKSEERFEKHLDSVIADAEKSLRTKFILESNVASSYSSGILAGLYAAKYAWAASKMEVSK